MRTPLESGIGGSQSALCYLAKALSQRGHEVFVVNGIAETGDYDGVRFVSWATGLTTSFLNGVDTIIVQNSSLASTIREEIGDTVPRILWTGHDCNQPAVQGLHQPRERESWRAFAFVSQWQAENYRSAFFIQPERSAVIHNGISPAFGEVPIKDAWFITGAPPILAYTSTPFRGLDVLLDAFALIRKAWPRARLRVYSNMSIYRIKPADDPFQALYARCANTEGVEYIGPVGQARLAGEMADAAALAYPSTFAETFCIAVAEAAAAGASIFTTRLGALPEINEGFADFVNFVPDKEKLARDFAELVVAGLQKMVADPEDAAARRAARIASYRSRFAWSRIAEEWERWLDKVVFTHPPVPPQICNGPSRTTSE